MLSGAAGAVAGLVEGGGPGREELEGVVGGGAGLGGVGGDPQAGIGRIATSSRRSPATRRLPP